MADEPATQPVIVQSPLAPEPVAPPPAAAPEREPVPAADRLRSFEDEHLGKDAVRIHDRVERGVGSPFQKLSDEHKRQYAALERLIGAEQKLASAHAALIAADTEHDAALSDVEPKPDGASVQ